MNDDNLAISKIIGFVFTSTIQWKNFIAISPSLTQLGYEVHFVSLDNYQGTSHKPVHIPVGVKFKHTTLERPVTNKILTLLFRRRFLIRFLPLFSLKSAWEEWLKNNKPDLVVFGVDHAIINSYMIYVCKQYGIKTAVLQDAYIPPRILDGKLWKNLLDRFRVHFNCYLPYTPSSFKSGVEFIGVIGMEAKKCIKPQLSKYAKISVVGSPRLEAFAIHANDILKTSVNSHNRQKGKIVFIQTNFDYVSIQLEYQQQMALIWLCKVIQSMNWQKSPFIEVILHTGTRNIGEYKEIQKRFKDIMVLTEGGINSSSIKRCDFCFSFGSTGLLDFFYAGIRCGILSSPKIKKPKERALLEFGLPHIESKNQLIGFLSQKPNLFNNVSENHTLRKKIANFIPEWNSIDKTSNWIASLIE